MPTTIPENLQPGSTWLVTVECLIQAVWISLDGRGFFIPGQEPCWALRHVAEWHHQVWPATGPKIRHMDDKPYTVAELRANMDERGWIEGIVAFDLDELRLDLDDFNDLASERVTGSCVGLEGIDYEPFGVLDGQFLVKVGGLVDGYLASLTDDAPDPVPSES